MTLLPPYQTTPPIAKAASTSSAGVVSALIMLAFM
jgi:hypothetical protein